MECFRSAARHLAPSGRLVVEAWVPDVGAFRHNRLVRPRLTGVDRISIETAELDPVEQVMRTTQAVFSNGSVRLYPANQRCARPADLDLMAARRLREGGAVGRLKRLTAHGRKLGARDRVPAVVKARYRCLRSDSSRTAANISSSMRSLGRPAARFMRIRSSTEQMWTTRPSPRSTGVALATRSS